MKVSQGQDGERLFQRVGIPTPLFVPCVSDNGEMLCRCDVVTMRRCSYPDKADDLLPLHIKQPKLS